MIIWSHIIIAFKLEYLKPYSKNVNMKNNILHKANASNNPRGFDVLLKSVRQSNNVSDSVSHNTH